VFKLIDLYARIATNTNTNTNALAENKTKNLTQSGAHTKDLPAQTFLRVSQTFGTHEKTIYAAVSQHTSHSDQANKQLQTAQLTHANRLAKSMANKAISLPKKKCGMPSSNPFDNLSHISANYLWVLGIHYLLVDPSTSFLYLTQTNLYLRNPIVSKNVLHHHLFQSSSYLIQKAFQES